MFSHTLVRIWPGIIALNLLTLSANEPPAQASAHDNLPASRPIEIAQQRAAPPAPRQTTPAPSAVQGVTTAPRVVARIELDNGNVVTFHEPEPGELLVVEEGKAPNPPALSREVVRRNKTAVDIHRALAPNREVPQALQSAQGRRASSQRQQQSQAPGDRELKEGGVRVQSTAELQKTDTLTSPGAPQASTGDWFQKNFCTGSADYNWCWLYRTGTTYYQKWSYSMFPIVYSCQGTVLFKFEYKSWGNWKSYTSWNVLQGHYVSWWAEGFSKKTRKSTVAEATNNCYHHAGSGS